MPKSGEYLPLKQVFFQPRKCHSLELMLKMSNSKGLRRVKFSKNRENAADQACYRVSSI